MDRKKVILLILDGWGHREDAENNAVKISGAPNFSALWNKYPKTILHASEEHVGLPKGQMGNSEVGHTNIGAGRIIYQDFLKINKAVDSGDIKDNQNIIDFFSKVKSRGGRVHFMGLVSDGGVHSHIKHLKGLLSAAMAADVKDSFVHAFTDGRDTPPNSGIKHIKNLHKFMNDINYGQIATVTGRYYAMDRDQRWERTEEAFRTLKFGVGRTAESPSDAVQQAYDKGETDEFIRPTVIGGIDGTVKDGDGIFFFNFRADRARQMTKAFTEPHFEDFDRGGVPAVEYISMTQYDKNFGLTSAFPPESPKNILGEVVSKAGLTQLRIAETEKYAHVTYFFNGGLETVFENEERSLIPSPKEVATYDMKPEMSVAAVADTFENLYREHNLDFVVMNFANPDMVGHTGSVDAAVAACKAVDEQLGRVIRIADETDSVLLVTADHGNCEQMWDYENDQPHTAHTLNPVPFIVKNFDCELNEKPGKLADIAPTILRIMGLEQPEEMTGECLIKKC